MAAPKGNNFNVKWKTPEERKSACEAVCLHLSSGLSKASFPLADWDTVERYMQEFPEDFPPEKVDEALRLQRLEWERLGLMGTKGEIDGFNATAWIFNMKNRFRAEWNDTVKTDVTSNGGPLTIQWKNADN